jgi:hypothetical protein
MRILSAIDQFEQLYADAQQSARVMALVAHPYIMGAPHQLRYFREALEHIQGRSGVVFWTGEQNSRLVSDTDSNTSRVISTSITLVGHVKEGRC